MLLVDLKGDPLDSFVEVNGTYCEGGGSFKQKSGGGSVREWSISISHHDAPQRPKDVQSQDFTTD